MGRILTFTPNPCLDETVWLRGDRELRRTYQTGGKGLNVGRVLAMLGDSVLAMAPLGGPAGEKVKALAQEEGLPFLPLPCTGETRTVTTKVQEDSYTQEQIFGPGALLLPENISTICSSIQRELSHCTLLVLSGRLPENALKHSAATREGILSLYPRLIAMAKEQHVPVWLDCHGTGTREAFLAGPDYMKPNYQEAIELTGFVEGRELPLEPDPSLEGAPSLLTLSWAKNALPSIFPLLSSSTRTTLLLSLGSQGSIYWKDGKGEAFSPYSVKTVNPVGCGDSFIGGFLHGFLRKLPPKDCMRLGAAAGAVNASKWLCGHVTPEEMSQIDPTLAPFL